MSFTESEMELLREGQRRGLLNRRQQEEIKRRFTVHESEDIAIETSDPSQLRPQGIEDLTGGFINRSTFEAAGGTLGGVLGGAGGFVAGAPTGPGAVITGTLGTYGGGALGSAGGSLAFDTTEDLLRYFDILPPKDEDLLDPTKRALRAARDDLVFGGGFAAAGALYRGIKPLAGKVLGMRTPEVAAWIQRAREANLVTEHGQAALGAIDAVEGARGKIIRGAGRVIGIFPWVGSPLRKQAIRKADIFTQEIEKTLNSLAPNAILADDLGIDMFKAAQGTFRGFRKTAGDLYNQFRQLAKKTKTPIVSTKVPFEIDDDGVVETVDGIKGLAKLFTGKKQAGKIILERGKKPTGPVADELTTNIQKMVTNWREKTGKITLEKGEELIGPIADDLAKYIQKLQRLPDRLTIQQVQAIGDELEGIVRKAASEGFDVKKLVQFKAGIEVATAADNLIVDGLSKELAENIVKSKKAADTFYSKGIVDFQTSTAQRFGRVDKNVFRVGFEKPGSLNADELADVAINLKSPAAIENLRTLVGDDVMNKVARRQIERAWDDALILDDRQVKGLNWESLKKELGLIGRQPERAEVMKAMLKNSPVNFEKVKSLINTASKFVVPKDVHEFIARRATLGGAGAGAAAVTGTAFVKQSLVKAMSAATIARYFMDIITSPAQLAAATRSFSPSITDTQRRLLVGRLIEAARRNEEQRAQP